MCSLIHELGLFDNINSEVRDEIENATSIELIEIATSSVRGLESSFALDLIRSRELPVSARIHQHRNGSYMQYWISENGPFDFSGAWHPPVHYFVESTQDGATAGCLVPSRKGDDSISKQEYPDSWCTHPQYMDTIGQNLSRVVSAFESREDHPICNLSGIRSVRQSAHEQCERYKQKGVHLLGEIHELLSGLASIGVLSLGVLPTKPSQSVAQDVYPVKKDGERKIAETRKQVAEEHSPAFLFRAEIGKLWDIIRWRDELDWHLPSITANAGIPENIAKQSESVLASLYRDLKSVDDNIVQPFALAVACEVIEAKIIQANRLPTIKEAMPEISSVYHNRTIRIGKTLRRFEKENGQFPPVKDYSQLKEWLAINVPEQFDVREVGPASYGKALKVTRCWKNERPGATKKLSKTIREAISYAQNNNER